MPAVVKLLVPSSLTLTEPDEVPVRLTGHVPAWPLASLSTLIMAGAGELVIVQVTVSNVSECEDVTRVVDDRGDVVAGCDGALVVDAHDADEIPAHAELAGQRLPDVVAVVRTRGQHLVRHRVPIGVWLGDGSALPSTGVPPLVVPPGTSSMGSG